MQMDWNRWLAVDEALRKEFDIDGVILRITFSENPEFGPQMNVVYRATGVPPQLPSAYRGFRVRSEPGYPVRLAFLTTNN